MAGTHLRNVEGMLQHRKNLHVEAIRRTDAALEALESSGSAITFQLVARRARVSRAWLYKQQDVRDRITALRRDHPWPSHAPAERASHASKEAMIRALRQRLAEERTANTKLANENKQLRKINEVLAGQVHLCRTYHTTNAGMASDYSRIVYHAPPRFSVNSEDYSPPEIRSVEDQRPSQ
jgi:uncharacterized protein DUF6262